LRGAIATRLHACCRPAAFAAGRGVLLW
jgi:hypothetical protein